MHKGVFHRPTVRSMFITVPSMTWLYKSRVTNDYCDSVISFAEPHMEDQTLSSVYSERSTDFLLHKKDGFNERILHPLSPYLNQFIRYANLPKGFGPVDEIPHAAAGYDVVIREAWVSLLGETGYTWPHNHVGEYGQIGSYSFVVYLGDAETTISFSSMDNWHTYFVTKGDILFFPSDISHMSFDSCANRTVFSCNLHVYMKKPEDEDGE